MGLRLYSGFETGEGERGMTNEEAVKTIPLGRYRHFKGNEYEVIPFSDPNAAFLQGRKNL